MKLTQDQTLYAAGMRANAIPDPGDINRVWLAKENIYSTREAALAAKEGKQ